jgi:uracil-DNA glycosylase family 4
MRKDFGLKVELNILDPGITGLTHSHKAHWEVCTRCLIGEQATHHVFSRGTLPCDILFIGEGPGRNEDEQGWPFIGDSGEMLERWIIGAGVKLSFAITNLVCCRPTEMRGNRLRNRPPSTEEIRNCRPRLLEFIKDIAKPRGLILVGAKARDFIPPELRTGKIPMAAVKHPSYIMQSGLRGSKTERDQVDIIATFAWELNNVSATN